MTPFSPEQILLRTDSINHGFVVNLGAWEPTKCRPVNWRSDGSLEYTIGDDVVRLAKPGDWGRMEGDPLVLGSKRLNTKPQRAVR